MSYKDNLKKTMSKVPGVESPGGRDTWEWGMEGGSVLSAQAPVEDIFVY